MHHQMQKRHDCHCSQPTAHSSVQLLSTCQRQFNSSQRQDVPQLCSVQNKHYGGITCPFQQISNMMEKMPAANMQQVAGLRSPAKLWSFWMRAQIWPYSNEHGGSHLAFQNRARIRPRTVCTTSTCPEVTKQCPMPTAVDMEQHVNSFWPPVSHSG